MNIRRLSSQEVPTLARTLGDSPATVIPQHQLRVGQATATLAGSPEQPAALVIQANDEPTAFGYDVHALWAILQTLNGWFCVEVEAKWGEQLAEYLAQSGITTRLYGDHYYLLHGTLQHQPQPTLETRLLAPADIPIWQASAPELNVIGFSSHAELLAHGVAAGSFHQGQLVALAHTSALSPRYADVGVYTAEAYRGQGLAAYAAELVMQQVVAQGRIPLWSTGADNRASRRVAQKLGLEEVLRRVYVILEAP